eukprot:TRINITY_DN15176_c0_g1::TRINITY_DN15176_c0_g1_i1::g.30601::m.30601 TRINITY_DN15176_c0_g1::TRINITY_DN15176_c0_g1_i1::g.30601  ORF type:complete len:566 (-),score=131.36,sp/Q52T38/ZDH22_ARATH/29.62/8e-55,zf-DHHC/PF01529.15/2.8e-37,Ank_2/PF12796.2/4.4e-06,Ank_2/PF12796.2/1.6e-11,Ank_2/PF12796.2/1.5e-13,Ank_4/PF13637.1/9.2e-06,Ank_4/PF13637.1/4.5e-09,Ank_4/PF13637.1/5e-06,Ank_4/PF13637.1/1.5e-13,Ank_4/PF13637.1/0.38,Ank_4/PF13637.1/1.2e+04,Ank_5/PF13857.1/0.0068,Ank_5/PF13857.1/3.1e-06,Ank_5/PF13857.
MSHGHSHSHGGGSAFGSSKSCQPPSLDHPYVKNHYEEEDIFSACALGHLTRCKALVEKEGVEILNSRDKDGHTCAHWASKNGFVDVLRWLKETGISLNEASTEEDRRRPIHWACTAGQLPVLHFMLNEVDNLDLNEKDRRGYTPLITATQFGHTTAVGYLLKKGADPCLVDNTGDSPLHWAAFKGHEELVTFLLAYVGLDVNERDEAGQTPLHLAAMQGHTSTVSALIEDPRCDPSIRDDKNRTASDIAREKKFHDTVAAIEGGHMRWLQLWTIGENTKLPFATPFLLIGIAYIILFVKVFPLLPEYELLHLSVIAASIIQWVFFFKASLEDPGYLSSPDDRKNLLLTDRHNRATARSSSNPDYENALNQMAETGSFEHHSHSLCHTCGIVRPQRAKHCRVCKTCVGRFDHHCPFINNCVGAGNQVYFMGYLWTVSLTIGLFLVELVLALFSPPHVQMMDGTMGDTVQPGRRSMDWVLLIVLLLYCIWTLLIWALCFSQIQLMCKNLTTNEYSNLTRYTYLHAPDGTYRNPFDKGFMHNCREYLGSAMPSSNARQGYRSVSTMEV